MLDQKIIERVNSFFMDEETRLLVYQYLENIDPFDRVKAVDFLEHESRDMHLKFNCRTYKSWRDVPFKVRSIFKSLGKEGTILNVAKTDYLTAAYINSRRDEVTSWVNTLCEGDKAVAESIISDIFKMSEYHVNQMNQLNHLFK